MLKDVLKYLDPWSAWVIGLTVVLFILALFVRGFTHDLFLEVGVLLVSAKLVIMSYKNSVLGEHMSQSLDEIKNVLARSLEPPGGR